MDAYATLTAQNGIEALEIIDRDPEIGVVLLDISMPYKGGVDTLAEIMKRRPQP